MLNKRQTRGENLKGLQLLRTQNEHGSGGGGFDRMVGEEKRHQMMQNLFGDQSEEEEEEEEQEIDSEHESNPQPIGYASVNPNFTLY